MLTASLVARLHSHGAVKILLAAKFLRTRMQPIRTASEIQVKIIINHIRRTPLYQRLAKKVEELSLLGMSFRAIARNLKVSKKTVINAHRRNR